MHALMSGCPVCTVKLLLLIGCFSDKLTDEDDDNDDYDIRPLH